MRGKPRGTEVKPRSGRQARGLPPSQREALVAYSEGRLGRAAAIASLKLSNYFQLLDALEREGVPRPEVSGELEVQMRRSIYETMNYPGGELLLTDQELKQHFDFILDILPIERAIGIVHAGGRAMLCAAEPTYELIASGVAEEHAMNGNQLCLFAYSMGQIGRDQARRQLGVDDHMFALLLRQSGFPPPRASEADEVAMLQRMRHLRLRKRK